ncbi:MAG: hypothetical protein K0Q63_1163 [Paenibacillus sp.]|nr:hypothetical protein [Paenibacillus sp.]
MVWTVIWFIANCLFVASLITFLFTHRSYAMARQQGADAGRLDRLKRIRMSIGIVSGICFTLMCASFLINMRLNG